MSKDTNPQPHSKAVKSSPLKTRLIKGILRFFALMPLVVGVALSRVIAQLMMLFNSRAYKVSKINVAICLPHLSKAEQLNIVKKSLIHTCRLFVEVAKVWYGSNNVWVENIYGKELVERSLNQGRGVLLTGAHIGNWEVLLHYLGQSFQFNCMYRPPRQQEMETVINQGRGQNNTTMLPGNIKGVLQMIEALNDGQVAAILSDQEPGRKGGIFVPFFERSALTMNLVQKISSKSQADLYQIAAIRNDNGKFDVYFEPVQIDINLSEKDYAQALNKQLEQMIGSFPEQYQWSYKRFKTTEDGSPNVYH